MGKERVLKMTAPANALRRIGAVALLCLRTALRSRIVLSLLLLLLLVLGVLPPLTQGDGTPAGEWRVSIAYPLTAAIVVLGFATLWAGCAVFAGEINAGRLQLTRIQPIRPLEIWLGHWLGLLLLNALLLTLVGVALAAWTPFRLDPELRKDPALRHPWETLKPDWVDPAHAARQVVARWRAEGRFDAEVPDRELFREAVRLLHAHYPLAGGETLVFPFVLNRPLDAGVGSLNGSLDLRAGTPMRRDLVGHLTVRDPDTDRSVTQAFDTRVLGHQETFRIDAAPLTGARRLEVSIHSGNDPEAPSVLVGREALTLRLPRGHHALNALRAAFALLGLLALLTAVGLAFGAVFSFPVAAFCASVTLVVVLLSRFVASQGFWWEDDSPSGLTRLTHGVVRAVTLLTAPLHADAPIARFATAEWIPGAALRRAGLLRLGVYPAVLGALAAMALKRREVGR